MTYLSEEIGNFSTILGNMQLDVEHDLRPFYAYTRDAVDGHCTRDGCIAPVPAKLEERVAAFKRLLVSLETLKANGLFENTAFALVSGRGNPLRVKDQLFTARVEERAPLFSLKLPEKFLKKHYQPRSTLGGNANRVKDQLFTARVEERAPLFSLKLPEKFLKKHYQPRSTLGGNANRLVTTKDVGLTLMDIASVSPMVFPEADEIDERIKATSLLSFPLPTYRSCDDAMIPPHLCLCMDEKAMQSEEYHRPHRFCRSKFCIGTNDGTKHIEFSTKDYDARQMSNRG
ncbi:unnamed protein product [Strongylus vulgaris]|uniref:Uncharacterized protein n=1 Tax=Strongylus vulgaris TaxID=40348 RepID=A0A3P7JLE5_STRVU|nr:unnamed protein product [Strongylus vulgaris]